VQTYVLRLDSIRSAMLSIQGRPYTGLRAQ
jgi:hypothetical protein